MKWTPTHQFDSRFLNFPIGIIQCVKKGVFFVEKWVKHSHTDFKHAVLQWLSVCKIAVADYPTKCCNRLVLCYFPLLIDDAVTKKSSKNIASVNLLHTVEATTHIISPHEMESHSDGTSVSKYMGNSECKQFCNNCIQQIQTIFVLRDTLSIYNLVRIRF